MSDLFWLTDEQMERLRPFFPKSHGKPRVDDRRVLSGIVFVNRNGLRWRDAPSEYGPTRRCTIGGSVGARPACSRE
jgi:transposase